MEGAKPMATSGMG